jgi:hypothetical protein
MVPGPSSTDVNEPQRPPLTCDVFQSRRSWHDRDDLDTVEVTGSGVSQGPGHNVSSMSAIASPPVSCVYELD